MRLGWRLGAAAPELRVPAVLDGDPAAELSVPRHGVHTRADRRGAAGLGGGGGRAGARRRGCGTGGGARPAPAALGGGLARAWEDERRLRAAAARWLGVVGASLGPRDSAQLHGVLDRIPGLFAAPPVLAHGDLAPVNLVLDGERLAGLLDLERMRVAPAGFDAAWFRLMVRHHHPEQWPAAAIYTLLEAAGLSLDPVTVARLDDLAVLACMEAAAANPRRSAARASWAARAHKVLRGELPGP